MPSVQTAVFYATTSPHLPALSDPCDYIYSHHLEQAFSGHGSSSCRKANMPHFCVSQALLALLIWSSPPYNATNFSDTVTGFDQFSSQHEATNPAIIEMPSVQTAVFCATTSPHLPALSDPCDYIYSHHLEQAFSGHGSSSCRKANMPHFCVSQVCTSLFSKRSDNRCLLLFPCPQVLCEIAHECFSMALLLLCSGDVELNPGPTTRSAAALEIETLPEEPSEQMNVIFQLLKDLQSRSVQSAESQTKLAADIKSIKAGQEQIETKLGHIQKRLDELEEKTKVLDLNGERKASMQESIDYLTTQQDTLQLRIDELEDRSRRENLLFYGIPDAQESWEQSETSIVGALSGVVDPLPQNAIERAHRLGAYHPNKCRPIIVKFSSYKLKDSVLAVRKKLKEKDITISEDFSPATRHARKRLLEFAKNQPNAPAYKLRYNKFTINKTQFVYDSATDSVKEHALHHATANDHVTASPRAAIKEHASHHATANNQATASPRAAT
ncbi:uncharacterized protein LOC144168480 [Haemaphysalis longicornis]